MNKQPQSVDELDQKKLPLLTADQLINLLGLHNRLRNIKRLTSLGQDRYDELYWHVISRYMEMAQLVPASASYHHADPGGLITHTVAVIQYALEERSRHLLPHLSDVDIQAKEKHVWTYAVFLGAILHDCGKLITQQNLVLSDSKTFSPFDPKISPLTYFLKFNAYPESYRLHKQIANTFYGSLVPVTAQTWIAEHVHIYDQLTAFLSGNADYWGSIGDIVQKADSQSVAENLGLTKSTRFIGATPPLSEKMMIALRQILQNGALGINKRGAGVFKQGATVWVLSKLLGDGIRQWLKDHNEAVPFDNTRIFDELEQFGYAKRGSKGITQMISVADRDGWQKEFNVVGFDLLRLYHPSTAPADFEGTIQLIQDMNRNNLAQDVEADTTENIKVTQKPTKQKASTTHSATESTPYHAEPVGKSKNQESRATSPLTANFEDQLDQHIGAALVGMTPTETGILDPDTAEDAWGYRTNNLPAETESNPTHAATGRTQAEENENATQSETERDQKHTGTGIEATKKPKNFVAHTEIELPPRPDCKLSDPAIATHFLEWLKLMIKHRRFEINENDSPVHMLPGNIIGIMTPRIFIKYCQDYNIPEAKKPFATIQTSARKKGLFLKKTGNTDVFKVEIIGKNKSLFFCLIDANKVLPYGVTPPVNITLRVIDAVKTV